MIAPAELLIELEPSQWNYELIESKQDVDDIIEEILRSHKLFKKDYDKIADKFTGQKNVLQALFEFCQVNFPYHEETTKLQSTRSPASLLERAGRKEFDCKHYSTFIGGVLDALRRKGYPIEWYYRFASYDTSEHVYVVVIQDGTEIWLDPAPINGVWKRKFNDRFVLPNSYKDKNIMALVRISGANQVGATMTIPMPKAQNDYTPLPEVKYQTQAGPLNLSLTGGILPNDLQIIYPTSYQGKVLPLDFPRPVVVGNRLVLLPKVWRDYIKADGWFWLDFLVKVMAPLVHVYSVKPEYDLGIERDPKAFGSTEYWTYHKPNTLWSIIMNDLDFGNMVDYVSMAPVYIPLIYHVPEGVNYLEGDTPITLPEDRGLPGADLAGTNPPPLPKDLFVVYPPTYLGLPVPAELPKPVNRDGKLQWSHDESIEDLMRSENFIWYSFLRLVIAPLINCYAKYPYVYTGDQLADRVWNDLTAGNEYVDNYLTPPETKTFLGKLFDTVGKVVEKIGQLIVQFIGIIPRTAFIGLLRLNVHGWATGLNDRAKTPAGSADIEKQWKKLGGNYADLKDAFQDGSKKSKILGVQTYQVNQNGELVLTDWEDNGFHYPLASMGEPTVVGLLAAAAPVIAAMGYLLKAIAPDSKAAKAVDDAITAINVILGEAGEDPIKLGAMLNKPVEVTDPSTGDVINIDPPPPTPTGTHNFFDDVVAFAKRNPEITFFVVVGIAGGIYYFTRPKIKK